MDEEKWYFKECYKYIQKPLQLQKTPLSSSGGWTIRVTFRGVIIYLFGSFGLLPPFGQWVFDKSRVRFYGEGWEILDSPILVNRATFRWMII